jgi:hypothetical protein
MGRGRAKSEKTLREEARQLQLTTDEMTGAVEVRAPLRRKPGRKGKKGARTTQVEIAVDDSDAEGTEAMIGAATAMGPHAADAENEAGPSTSSSSAPAPRRSERERTVSNRAEGSQAQLLEFQAGPTMRLSLEDSGDDLDYMDVDRA